MIIYDIIIIFNTQFNFFEAMTPDLLEFTANGKTRMEAILNLEKLIQEWDTLNQKKTKKASADDMILKFKVAIILDNIKKKIKGVPIAGYDKIHKKAYLEYCDGHKVYVQDKNR